MADSVASPALSDMDDEEESESSRSEMPEPEEDTDDEANMTVDERLAQKTEKLEQCEDTIKALIQRINAYQKIVEQEKERDQAKIRRMVEEMELERQRNLSVHEQIRQMAEELDENNKALARELEEEQEAHKETVRELFALREKIDDPDNVQRKDQYCAEHDLRLQIRFEAGRIAGVALLPETFADTELARLREEGEFTVKKLQEVKQTYILAKSETDERKREADEQRRRADAAEENMSMIAQKMRELIGSHSALLERHTALETAKADADARAAALQARLDALSSHEGRHREQIRNILRHEGARIYDKYCAENAELELPLSAPTRRAIADAIFQQDHQAAASAASASSDDAASASSPLPPQLFEAASKEIVRIIDAEHLPRWRRSLKSTAAGAPADLPERATFADVAARPELLEQFRDYMRNKALNVDYLDFVLAAADFAALCTGTLKAPSRPSSLSVSCLSLPTAAAAAAASPLSPSSAAGVARAEVAAIAAAAAAATAAATAGASSSSVIKVEDIAAAACGGARTMGGTALAAVSGVPPPSVSPSVHGKPSRHSGDRGERAAAKTLRDRRATVLLPRSLVGAELAEQEAKESARERKHHSKRRDKGEKVDDSKFVISKTGSTGDLPRPLSLTTRRPSDENLGSKLTTPVALGERKPLRRTRGESLLRIDRDRERRSSVGDPSESSQSPVRRPSSASLQVSITSDQLPQPTLVVPASGSGGQPSESAGASQSTGTVSEGGSALEGAGSPDIAQQQQQQQQQQPAALPMNGLQYHIHLPGPVTAMIYAKKNIWVACSGSNSSVSLLDRETSRLVLEVPFGDTVRSMCVVNKTTMWVGGESQRVRVFDLVNPMLSRELTGPGHTLGPIVGIEVVGKHVWTIGYDQKICLWDLKQSKLYKTIYVPATCVTCMTVYGTIVWVGTALGVMWWDGTLMKQMPASPSKDRNPKYNVSKLAVVDKEVWAAHFEADKISIWDAEKRECKGEIAASRVKDIAALGNQVWTCSWDKMIRLWDKQTRQCIREIPMHEDAVVALCVAKCAGNLRVWAGSDDNTISVWNTQYVSHDMAAGSMRSHACAICGKGAFTLGGQSYVCKVCESYCVHAKCLEKIPMNSVCQGPPLVPVSSKGRERPSLAVVQPRYSHDASDVSAFSAIAASGAIGGAVSSVGSPSPTRQLAVQSQM